MLMLPEEKIPSLSDYGFLTYCYLNESPYTIITFFMFRVFFAHVASSNADFMY